MTPELFQHLSILAARRAIHVREEAQLWDILSRDLKREAGKIEAQSQRRDMLPAERSPATADGKQQDRRMFVSIAEAARMMGIGRSTLYSQIGEGQIAVRKAGKRTLIAVAEIEAWFSRLPGHGPR
jgi:excisionase family DNA binding protein